MTLTQMRFNDECNVQCGSIKDIDKCPLEVLADAMFVLRGIRKDTKVHCMFYWQHRPGPGRNSYFYIRLWNAGSTCIKIDDEMINFESVGTLSSTNVTRILKGPSTLLTCYYEKIVDHMSKMNY